ncbi:MAG: endonuclease [Bacteroidia bacterium]|nr:endonuclease [Bacteroidia bacterium]
MPEGPSIVILKELLQPYQGKVIQAAEGVAAIDFKRLEGKKLLQVKSWGKHTLLCFKDFYIRIHLLMFGSYRINERREQMTPKLTLVLKGAEVNFYTCQVKLMEGKADDDYAWDADIMAAEWDAKKALKKIRALRDAKICDVLLDQEIFSGSGNIIKNEVLFRVAVHPESRAGAMPLKKLKELVNETRNYSFDFLKWKKANVLQKHWLIYKKAICPRCHLPVKTAHLGKGKRLSCFCKHCQELFN